MIQTPRWLSLCLSALLLCGCAANGARPLATEQARHDLEVVLATVEKNYVVEVNPRLLVEDAIQGMYHFAGVAPLSDAELLAHSPPSDSGSALPDPLLRFSLTYDYLLGHAVNPLVRSQTKAQDDKPPVATDRVDIGVLLARDGEWIRIAAVVIDSAAEAAGLNRGDAIIAIDNHATSGQSLAWCYQQLSGVAGTVVKVTVHTEEGEVVNYRIVRTRLLTPAVVLLRMPVIGG